MLKGKAPNFCYLLFTHHKIDYKEIKKIAASNNNTFCFHTCQVFRYAVSL